MALLSRYRKEKNIMSTHPNTPSLHPALWVAAASITAVSLAGVAKLTGLLPDFSSTPPAVTETVATPTAPLEAPPPQIATTPAAPAVAPEQAAPAKPAAASSPTARVERPEHKPSSSAREHARPAPAVARSTPPPADAVPASPQSSPRHVADAPPPCRDCGVIEHVEAIQQKGEGSGIGAVGGAILGGVLGHQVGEGSGKQLARIGGAVLGGLAGNEAEKRTRTITHYRITVRMEDGSRQVIEQPSAPVWRNGDPVRIRNGEIVAKGGETGAATGF